VTTRTFPMEIREIVAGLTRNIEPLVRQILPRGIREGSEWCVGSVAGEPGRSTKVNLRSGLWADFAAGENVKGDPLDLVARVLFRGDRRDAIRWAVEWLGIERESQGSNVRAPGYSADQIGTFAVDKDRDQENDRDKEARTGAACRIFLEAQPHLARTPADRYLLSRGIDLKDLCRKPGALRFHEALWHSESQRTWPGLVAAISLDSRIVAVHRTFLRPDGSGKAPVNNPKKTLGPYRGGAIRLWRGSTGLPLKDVLDDDTIVIGEGLEDSLTAAVAAPHHRVLCAVSLSNLAAVKLPAQIKTVIILAQNDPPGSAAAQGLQRAVASFQAQGRVVKIARPPANYKDFNDIAQRAPR
jgi:hypothetical protein